MEAKRIAHQRESGNSILQKSVVEQIANPVARRGDEARYPELARSLYLETARHMLASGRFLYVVFMCHLALEKMLKAHFVEVTQSVPPRTHDLIYLTKKSKLALPQVYLEFIGRINNASVLTRYPKDLQRIIAQYPESVARDYLKRTEEVLEWLREHPNLR